jgi:transcriptional regulator with XRE-family HTH domain
MTTTKQLLPVKFVREIAGYRQVDVADKLGVNRASINRWENGEGALTYANSVKLAELYDYPLDSIFFGSVSQYREAMKFKIETK